MYILSTLHIIFLWLLCCITISFSNNRVLQLIEFLYFLPADSDQLVDFGDLPIEEAHNLILLGAGRNRKINC